MTGISTARDADRNSQGYGVRVSKSVLHGAFLTFYSASAAAQINRQAEQMQALGAFGGEMTRAESGKAAGELGIRARQSEKLAQIFGQQDQQTSLANAGRDIQNNAAYQQYMQTYRTMEAARTKENNDNRVAAHQQREMQKYGAIGEAFSIGGRNMSPLGRGGDKGKKIGTNIRHTGRQLLDWLEAGGRTNKAA
jgi:hypothetical protein